MIESHPEGQQSSIIYQLSSIIYHLSTINYEQERTLAEDTALCDYDSHGDSHHPGHHLVHRDDELIRKEGAILCYICIECTPSLLHTIRCCDAPAPGNPINVH